MSEAQREQLTAILDDIYEGFTTGIAQSRGKTTQEVCEPKSLRKSSFMCQEQIPHVHVALPLQFLALKRHHTCLGILDGFFSTRLSKAVRLRCDPAAFL